MTHFAVTEAELTASARRYARVALAIGIVIGVCSAFAASYYADSVAIFDLRMESGCHWPRHEGEMTVVTVLKGEVVCWRWK